MEAKTEENKTATNKELLNLYNRGLWNSGILTFMCISITASNFTSGSYWGVGFGVLAAFVCGRDTISFYKHFKSAKGA